MTTTWEQREIKKAVCGRISRRPATDAEIEYALNLDPLAEQIQSDERYLYWSSLGDAGECSVQKPYCIE